MKLKGIVFERAPVPITQRRLHESGKLRERNLFPRHYRHSPALQQTEENGDVCQVILRGQEQHILRRPKGLRGAFSQLFVNINQIIFSTDLSGK